MRLTLGYLAKHREFIPQLAVWSYAQWHPVYSHLGMTFDDVLAAHTRRTNTDALPLGIVASAAGELLGTGALKTDDLPLRPDLTPWIGGIFVAPEHRGRGVATAIIDRLVEEARRLQLPRLYLWTDSAASLYAKLGWDEIEKLEYCGYDITVMGRELTPGQPL